MEDNPNIICECEHALSEHRFYDILVRTPCDFRTVEAKIGRGYSVTTITCSCPDFKVDNLRYLELKAKENER